MTRTKLIIGWASRTRPSRVRAGHYLDESSPTLARRSKCARAPLVLFKDELPTLPPDVARRFRAKTICDHCQTAVRMARQAERAAKREDTRARRKRGRLTGRGA